MCNDFSEFETIGLERIDLVVVVVVVVERAGGRDGMECMSARHLLDRRDETRRGEKFQRLLTFYSLFLLGLTC